MRKAMRHRSTSPPLHVHVSDDTPVHVHIKSFRKSPNKTQQGKIKTDAGSLRPTATVRTRVPWIPPGKTSIRDSAFKWEGLTHRLEIVPPLPEPEPEPASETQHSPLRLADLATDEEEEQGEGLHGRISQYERKIDSLMTEVGSLKNEVELRKKAQQLERQSERLSASKRVIAEQEEELAEVTKELVETERENSRLRQSMEKMLEESDVHRPDRTPQDKDALLRKLMEAEVDGVAAAKQVSALRESVSKLGGATRASAAEVSGLDHQKMMLLQKLETFENTNRALRHLLREQHGSKMESVRLSEQKDDLLKRLGNMEADNALLVVKLQEREKEVDELSRLLDTEKDNSKSTVHLSKSLESTRAHLQGQLRSKEAENNRLVVQIKNLERAAERQKVELEHLKEQLTRQKQQASADRDALKRATRVQKQRAERCQDTTGQLSVQLLDMEKQLTEALSTAESWQSLHTQQVKDKSKLEMEVSLLNSRISELTEQIRSAEDKSRLERETLLDRLHVLTTENTAAKLDNQALKVSATTVDEKLLVSQSELQQVRASIRQYESLLDSYKIQVGKTRAEADDFAARLARAEQAAQAVRGKLDQEVDEVRRELQGRLAELEPLPDALRRAELRLQEAQDRERGQERRSAELGNNLTELRMKVETQGNHMDLLRQKNKVLLEENRRLQQRVETLEKTLEDSSAQNSELLSVLSKREDAVHSNQLRLEEKTRECSLLSRGLEEALDDARRQVSESRERASTKERSTQAKIVELETQLSRTTSEINQLRRSKEEAERRYQSRLQDMTDRLEQSDSTNQSLQNYVQFLKESYTNVFGDVVVSSSLQAPPSPI